MATARILSIDDSPTVLKLIEMIGRAAGYEVHVADNGRRGVEMAAELHPDVILVDFIMPEMNGLQVCKALHDNPETRDIPIILVSSKGEAVGDKFVTTLGVRHYCTKPFKAEELLAKLSEILGERSETPPAPPAAAPAATTEESEASGPERPASREAPVVLSIDDSPTILRLVEMILANAGFSVRTAAGGTKGIELARQLHPEVVLVDFIMPEVNGFQVAKTLREDPETRDIPIILVSSKGEAVGEQFVQTLGIHHYLTKPFQPDQLVAEVRSALAACEVEREAHESVEEDAPEVAAEPTATGPTGDPEVDDTLRAHLDAQLAAMEERLVSILERRLQEVLEEIRNRAPVGSR